MGYKNEPEFYITYWLRTKLSKNSPPQIKISHLEMTQY